MIRPSQLRCEYRENPLGIDTPAPRLSWILHENDSAARDVRQAAYQIDVSDGDGQLWDSGKVKSVQSIHIPYSGKPLRSAQRPSWKVRVWDAAGKQSDWSDPADFTMGLLTAD